MPIHIAYNGLLCTFLEINAHFANIAPELHFKHCKDTNVSSTANRNCRHLQL